MWNLENRKALVTGGSKGIGEAIVKELASLGAEVLFTGRDQTDIDKTEESLKKEGLQVSGLQSDVTKEEDQKALAKVIEQRFSKLDILVNNAGMNIRKSSHEYSREEYQKIIDTDLTAPFEISVVMLPLLKRSQHASVINISSVAAIVDDHTGAPYGMAKAGLLQMTRSLAREWAAYGIRVNAVSPWFTLTPLTKSLLAQPEKIDPVLSRTPMKRVAKAEEMAGAVAFLAMDKASYITGQNIVIDGGMSIHAL
ncbi:SDR family oxidoreductase [Robertkochia aurantiaca]|uniref:SDR family oxidoreductase n=1 Tax=Robertkochia aurantiaca TaxID=2873700 RepID=UPI001CCBD565|nr:SDR family oxidoreductase [Robertkochia sp. 3YJGBD-33]